MKKKIALFGGSFDPFHTDHLNIAKSCYQNLGFDEVW
ncbi:putative nicotinate-nucleotide adenylyltransferase, partial [Mycoplasma putrefaciens]